MLEIHQQLPVASGPMKLSDTISQNLPQNCVNSGEVFEDVSDDDLFRSLDLNLETLKQTSQGTSKPASKQFLNPENESSDDENPPPNDGKKKHDAKKSVYVFPEEIKGKTEELIATSGVFIESSTLKNIKRTSSVQTTMARALLCGIFTEETLLTHSLKGIGTTKPGLPKAAIEAILSKNLFFNLLTVQRSQSFRATQVLGKN
ncbi:uncharacterized protein LOC127279237 [Leptopilina boulardi]|uniref:uncharacterized protein LOC127279237 n=1 Tax=Leptopilina boulardi TaxID=63433 RepID=UPI0021F570F1|nr:uncharacterized protein LOC127279237 [Leptopilina boulardi]